MLLSNVSIALLKSRNDVFIDLYYSLFIKILLYISNMAYVVFSFLIYPYLIYPYYVFIIILFFIKKELKLA